MYRMKKTIGLLVLSSALAPAQITEERREFAVSYLHATRKVFLDSVAGLSDAQWNFKPAPERWSIAECAEHIALSEDFIFHYIETGVMKSPVTPGKKPDMTDDAVVKGVADRSHKAKAPEPLKPANHFATPSEAIAHFKESRDSHIAWADKTQDDLLSHLAPLGEAGQINAYQWVLMMSSHTERHTAQINEVKADPKFPGN